MAPEGTLSFAGKTDPGADVFVAPYLVRLSTAEAPQVPSVRLSLAEVDRTTFGRGAATEHRRGAEDGVRTLDCRVLDAWMSTHHASMHRQADGWRLRDQGSKNGTLIDGERVEERLLVDGDVFELGNTFFLFRSSVSRSFRQAADGDASALAETAPGLRTLHPELERELADLSRIARSQLSVLLLGETGTGKEITARAVHASSGRAGPFVAVNCGALAPDLVESELFGHVKGAFSGANADKIGYARASSGGTLFLDEIAEMPAHAQVALLRLLQEKEVVPVGAARPVTIDLRVVAATHRDLDRRMAEEQFRSDLHARLTGHSMQLPPLRERVEDLGMLIASALDKAGHADRPIERDALRALLAYDWPANVRELEQALAKAVALADGAIALEHLPEAIRSRPATAGADDELRRELDDLLRQHGGNVSAVAREMGKARVQIRRWCKRLGLEPDGYRGK